MEEKKKNFKNRNLFVYLNNILCLKDMELYKKQIAEEGFDADFKKVVLVRYLSMSKDPRIREIVFKNQLLFERTDCKTLYRYLIRVVPKQMDNFIRYIK
jgi:hypothetical protein